MELDPSVKMEIAEAFTNAARSVKRVQGRLENVRQALIKTRKMNELQSTMTELSLMSKELDAMFTKIERMIP